MMVEAESGEQAAELPADTRKKTPEERKALLGQTIANWVSPALSLSSN